jgi:hypothetical protein
LEASLRLAPLGPCLAAIGIGKQPIAKSADALAQSRADLGEPARTEVKHDDQRQQRNV